MAKISTEDFLAHYGVKGMKWGRRKAAGLPTRKELRGMDKAARARQKEEAERKGARNDAQIKRARSKMGETRLAIKDAKRQYKTDKRKVGKVVAKEIMDKNLERPMKSLKKAGEMTQREAEINKIITDILVGPVGGNLIRKATR